MQSKRPIPWPVLQPFATWSKIHMTDIFVAVFEVLDSRLIMVAAILFFVGYVLAPTAYYKDIKWLTAYPFFMIRLMDKHFKKDWHAVTIFLVIFLLNSFSLFVNLLSGWVIFLPYMAIIYMGLNVGIIMYHTLEGKYYYLSLINPVTLLELPAAWISVALAIQFSLAPVLGPDYLLPLTFGQCQQFFMQTIIPLLLVGATVETWLIIMARKHEENED